MSLSFQLRLPLKYTGAEHIDNAGGIIFFYFFIFIFFLHLVINWWFISVIIFIRVLATQWLIFRNDYSLFQKSEISASVRQTEVQGYEVTSLKPHREGF